MQNQKLYDLMVLIFQQTLGIKRSKNADPERGGSFQDLFPSYQLGRDLKDVSEGKLFLV